MSCPLCLSLPVDVSFCRGNHIYPSRMLLAEWLDDISETRKDLIIPETQPRNFILHGNLSSHACRSSYCSGIYFSTELCFWGDVLQLSSSCETWPFNAVVNQHGVRVEGGRCGDNFWFSVDCPVLPLFACPVVCQTTMKNWTTTCCIKMLWCPNNTNIRLSSSFILPTSSIFNCF